MTNHIAENLALINKLISESEQIYHRMPHSVTLLAVSKGQNLTAIKTAIEAGQTSFGENYLQEALPKIKSLNQYSIEWHFIGNIQTNKTKLIAQNFSWVHSIDRLKIAERLNRQRPLFLPPLNVCIAVNIDEETTKSGVKINHVLELAKAITQFPHLKLRGLMTIPQFRPTFAQQFCTYHKIFSIQQELIKAGFFLDTLSMGMSNDFKAAIAGGSTLIRIGTAIFGKRFTSPVKRIEG